MEELPHPPVSTATHNSCRREEGAALAGAADEPGLGWILLHQPWPTRVLGHGQRVIKTCIINKQLLKLKSLSLCLDFPLPGLPSSGKEAGVGKEAEGKT